ncbi:unnamed protein product [Vitrella brassicaformis CCMP3155]|uniref:N-acetyltransferase domain-containing protein n=1 Tax=Vitrella brassicaformis (strain CCMP3155) TaxID=1169540 RepID=A0A0G4EKA9_VITBC|nr:unnamed protein product [Vitrella brassicaformis CCMP3155]|eukprot:CEL97119.1 unnamed protein product [Vitrella brassicaformis CCMP3155]
MFPRFASTLRVAAAGARRQGSSLLPQTGLGASIISHPTSVLAYSFLSKLPVRFSSSVSSSTWKEVDFATAPPDPVEAIMTVQDSGLSPIFTPRSVAVIGATDKPRSVGGTLMRNLVTGGFSGPIYAVNPKREEVMGVQCFPSVKAIPGDVDLVVIVTPSKGIPALMAECVEKNVRGAVVISAGFKEIGPEGVKLEEQLLETAAKGGIRIVGPNCLGLMNPIVGLNATFASEMALPGKIGFISQSGAMCTSVLDWSLKEKIGFSAFVSIGSMADVNWADLIDYLGKDPHTDSILMYMEAIGDARAFLSAAKEVALKKPLIVIKAGRTEAAAKAASSHTGSLAGADNIFDAAMKRAGVLRVDTIGELFDVALTLAKQNLPKGPRLVIITNAGGPGVLATDAAALNDAEIATLDESTINKLNQFLPPAWSHSNPVDVLGDASPETYAKAVEVVAEDPNSDGMLVVLSPQDMTEPTNTAEMVLPSAHKSRVPVIASWMGGSEVERGAQLLNKNGVPSIPYPDSAAAVFAKIWSLRSRLEKLYETPTARIEVTPELLEKQRAVKGLLQDVSNSDRSILTELESKQVLKAYGIPVVETILCETVEDAVTAARDLGYPVVVKLNSETITHKTDVGGVQLNLSSEDMVREAFDLIQKNVAAKYSPEDFQGVTVQQMADLSGYELLVGSSVDPQFGPVVVFGSGGTLVEVMHDTSLALPPLTSVTARALMKETKIYKALQGIRGRLPINIAELEKILVSFSAMVVDQPLIMECDINPLLASPSQLLALDARVIVAKPGQKVPKVAIRGYPLEYVSKVTLRNNEVVTVRPIRASDEPLLIEFHTDISERSLRQRFFKDVSFAERTAHSRLSQLCNTDYDRGIVLIATDDKGRMVGFCAYRKRSLRDTTAEYRMLIRDAAQGKGLGTAMMTKLVEIAKTEGIKTLTATVSKDNTTFTGITKMLGFQTTPIDDKLIEHTLTL